MKPEDISDDAIERFLTSHRKAHTDRREWARDTMAAALNATGAVVLTEEEREAIEMAMPSEGLLSSMELLGVGDLAAKRRKNRQALRDLLARATKGAN